MDYLPSRNLKPKNASWQRTDDSIVSALYDLLNQSGSSVPTHTAIANKTNLSVDCVRRHMKDKTINDFTQDFKQYLPKIIETLGNKAIDGDVPVAKLFLELNGHKNNMTMDATIQSDSVLQIKFVGVDDDITEIVNYDIVNEDDSDPDNEPVDNESESTGTDE